MYITKFGIIFVALILSVSAYIADCRLNQSFNSSNEVVETSLGLADGTTERKCQHHTWLVDNGGRCSCANSLNGIIYCDSSLDVFIMSQFCMTYSERTQEEVVGRCPYTFMKFIDPNVSNIGLYYKLPEKTRHLEHDLCSSLNRHGLLCGKCRKGYGYPMYPDFITCVECRPSQYAGNWVLYIVISFGPLTLFLILVVCLRISATSASMNSFIFISQIISHPPFARGFNHIIDHSFLHHGAKTFLKLLHSLYGIWNLNFFTALIPPFCLPHQNVFNVITLTYIIALYPLLLLILLYVLIELHSRNIKVLVWLWKPFHLCYFRFRRQWNIKASVIDAFATFLLLSYVKILFVSSDFLAPTTVWNKNGSVIELVSYFDASAVISPKPKTVLIMVAIGLILLFFIFLPVILLLLYPCRLCQKCLTCSRMRFQALNFLMESFHGCYKDGTNGSLDCRYFAAIFLVMRIVICIEYGAWYFVYYSAVIITCTVVAVMIAVVQPYNEQNSIFNRLDPLMILFLVIWIASYKDIRIAAGTHLFFQYTSITLCFLSLILPPIIVVLYLLRKFAKRKWPRNSRLLEDSFEQRSHSPHVSQCRSYGSLGHERSKVHSIND